MTVIPHTQNRGISRHIPQIYSLAIPPALRAATRARHPDMRRRLEYHLDSRTARLGPTLQRAHGGERGDGVGHAAAAAPPRRPYEPPIPKSLSYDGKGKWHTFYFKFDAFAKQYNWSEDKRKHEMNYCLQGNASDYYTTLWERDPRAHFRDLMAQMKKRFEGQEPLEVSHMEFVSSKQAPNESLKDWADRLTCIARKAFPGLEKQVSRQITVRFCQGCLDKDAGMYAFNKRPTTLEDAVEAALWQQRSAAAFGRTKRDVLAVGTEEWQEEPKVCRMDYRRQQPPQRQGKEDRPPKDPRAEAERKNSTAKRPEQSPDLRPNEGNRLAAMGQQMGYMREQMAENEGPD